jgi:hypothetical protein
MKRRAYYTNSEAMAIYTKVDDFVAALTPPATVATAGKMPIHTTTVGKWKFMHTQKIYVGKNARQLGYRLLPPC